MSEEEEDVCSPEVSGVGVTLGAKDDRDQTVSSVGSSSLLAESLLNQTTSGAIRTVCPLLLMQVTCGLFFVQP